MIGNPPYGAIINDNKDLYTSSFKCTEGKFEIYKYFYEIGISLINENGVLSFITPDTWKTLSNFKKIRKILFDNLELISITESLYDIFENATVDTAIVIFKKSEEKNKKYKLLKHDLTTYIKKAFRLDEDYILNFKDTNALIEKINSQKIKLNNITEIWQGLIAYAGKSQPRIWTSDKKETKDHRKLLYGKDVSKYGINWSGEYLKYGDWLHRPRPAYIFDDEKILVQRIRNPQLKNRLICAYDNEKYTNGTGLSNILILQDFKDKYSIKFILGILNSTLINYWFSYYFVDVNIKPEQLRKIPIPSINIEKQKPIIAFVEKILDEKKADTTVDTSKLEHKIDELVYQLYDLTPDEIAIVEGK